MSLAEGLSPTPGASASLAGGAVSLAQSQEAVGAGSVRSHPSVGTSGSSNGAPTASSSAGSGTPLVYPRDYFGIKNGKIPKDDNELKALWAYRKDRPKAGVDRSTPDAAKMYNEMLSVRKSLRTFISDSFDAVVLGVARKLELKVNRQTVRTKKDLQQAILELKPSTDESIQLLWNILYQPFRREWHATTIDKWMLENDMKLQEHPDTEQGSPDNKNKIYKDERGGFSHVASVAKAGALRKYTTPLFQKRHWKIAVNNEEKKGGRKYTKKSLSWGTSQDKMVWLVEQQVQIRLERFCFPTHSLLTNVTFYLPTGTQRGREETT